MKSIAGDRSGDPKNDFGIGLSLRSRRCRGLRNGDAKSFDGDHRRSDDVINDIDGSLLSGNAVDILLYRGRHRRQ